MKQFKNIFSLLMLCCFMVASSACSEDDFGPDVTKQILVIDPFDGADSAHRHENRGLDLTVPGGENPCSCPTSWICRYSGEPHSLRFDFQI